MTFSTAIKHNDTNIINLTAL